MIEKVKTPCPPCKNAVIPCDYGDEVSLMEQIAKYKQELKDTIASYKKEIEGLIQGLEDLNAKVQTLEQSDAELNSQLGDKVDKLHTHGAEGSVYAVKDAKQTSFDVSTSSSAGKIPLYKAGGTLNVSRPEDDGDATPKEYLDMVVSEVQQQIEAELADKVNVIPKPSTGSIIYGINSDNASNQPIGFRTGTTQISKFSIVQRTDNGQIVLPNQDSFPPTDGQAISKRYADRHYGAALQRLLHYLAYDTGWGNGTAFEHTVPLPIRSNDDGVYYNITDHPSMFGADYTPDVVSLTIGDGSVAEASWSTNGVVVTKIVSVFGEAYSGNYTRWDSSLIISSETCHAFNTKAEYDAWKMTLKPEGSWSGSTPQVGYWVEYI